MTIERMLYEYSHLPWTILVRREDDGRLVALVQEMPDAIADGADEKELQAALAESILESLQVRIERGDPIPVPNGVAVVDRGPPRITFVPRTPWRDLQERPLLAPSW